MRYCPVALVVTDRTFSISAGLDASTLTPGSSAPDVSRATPVIDACAWRSEGMRRSPREAHAVFSRGIQPPDVYEVARIIARSAPVLSSNLFESGQSDTLALFHKTRSRQHDGTLGQSDRSRFNAVYPETCRPAPLARQPCKSSSELSGSELRRPRAGSA